MAKTVQLRDVRDETYRTLRMRAASEGLSLTAYLKRELDRLASTPTMTEWLEGATDREWGVERSHILQAIHDVREEVER